jgi:hypothetical protein
MQLNGILDRGVKTQLANGSPEPPLILNVSPKSKPGCDYPVSIIADQAAFQNSIHIEPGCLITAPIGI